MDWERLRRAYLPSSRRQFICAILSRDEWTMNINFAATKKINIYKQLVGSEFP